MLADVDASKPYTATGLLGLLGFWRCTGFGVHVLVFGVAATDVADGQ